MWFGSFLNKILNFSLNLNTASVQAEIPIRTNFDEKLVEQNHVVSSSDIRDSSPGSYEETDTPYVSPKRSKNTEKGSSSQQSLPNKHFLGKRKPNSVDIPPELVAINSGPRLRGNPRGRPRKHLTARPRGRGKGRTTVRNFVSVIHEPITRWVMFLVKFFFFAFLAGWNCNMMIYHC